VAPSANYRNAMPASLRRLYSPDNLDRYFMTLSHVFLGESDPPRGELFQLSLPDLAAQFGGNTVTPAPSFSANVSSFYTVNGQYQPTVYVASGSTALFRMLHAVGTRVVVLKISRPDLCEIRLIARDGVFQQGQYTKVSKLTFIHATRADYAVLCTLPHDEHPPVTINVFATDNATEIGALWGNVHTQSCVFKVVVSHIQKRRRVFMPTEFAPLPHYLSDLLSSPVEETQVIDMLENAINGRPFPGFHAPLHER
jgi:hypothetical protein